VACRQRRRQLSFAAQGCKRVATTRWRLSRVTVQPGLLRYLRGLVGQDAEDVASEAWLNIARDLPGLRDTHGFRGWAACRVPKLTHSF
jgi:RNA polymerase sigma-70 factor (ECF subfamily)